MDCFSDGALDRFSQFFLSPLFTESATEREVNAVNSEHEKNIPHDTWRSNQIEKSTANPNHDFFKFGTGNKETLDIKPKAEGISVRDSLLEFHRQSGSLNILEHFGLETLKVLWNMLGRLILWQFFKINHTKIGFSVGCMYVAIV